MEKIRLLQGNECDVSNHDSAAQSMVQEHSNLLVIVLRTSVSAAIIIEVPLGSVELRRWSFLAAVTLFAAQMRRKIARLGWIGSPVLIYNAQNSILKKHNVVHR